MLGEELSIDNIITGEEVEDLFSSTSREEPEKQAETKDEKDTKEETTEVNADTLFGDTPESVSSEESEDDNNQEKGGAESEKDSGASPQSSFYSSIATALRDEGILPDLDDEVLKKIKDPEDFAQAIEKQLQAKFEERQRRVDEALQAGVETPEVKRYENILGYLDTLEGDKLKDESEEGENIRKNLIYQDFINKGFSETRAKRETEKSFSAGTDVEDATEALNSNKEFFQSSYQKLIDEAKNEDKKLQEQVKKQSEDLKKSILSEDKVFGELQLDKSTRQRVLDNLTKPMFKDENGQYLTALQKAERDNRTSFLKNMGIVFTLTNGFKDLDGLVKGRVKKETRKSLKELEHVLSNTSRNSSGNLTYLTGTGGADDPESKIGLKLDI